MNKAQRKRKVRSNKGKKRRPYGPRSRTRSGKKFRGGSKSSKSSESSESLRPTTLKWIQGVAKGLYNPESALPNKEDEGSGAGAGEGESSIAADARWQARNNEGAEERAAASSLQRRREEEEWKDEYDEMPDIE